MFLQPTSCCICSSIFRSFYFIQVHNRTPLKLLFDYVSEMGRWQIPLIWPSLWELWIFWVLEQVRNTYTPPDKYLWTVKMTGSTVTTMTWASSNFGIPWKPLTSFHQFAYQITVRLSQEGTLMSLDGATSMAEVITPIDICEFDQW